MIKIKHSGLYKFGIILVAIFCLLEVATCMGTSDKSTDTNDILTEKKIITALKKEYKNLQLNKNTSGKKTPPTLKITTPPEGGRVITNKDKTHVTLSIDSIDEQNGIKMVCGTRISNISQPDFVIDDTPPYVLVLGDTPLGEQSFMVFAINNAGMFKSKVITVNVKKVTSFRIIRTE